MSRDKVCERESLCCICHLRDSTKTFVMHMTSKRPFKYTFNQRGVRVAESRERGNAAPRKRALVPGSATHPTLFFPLSVIALIEKFQKMLKTIDHSDCSGDKCLWEWYHADLSEIELDQVFMKTKIDHANMRILTKIRLSAVNSQILIADGV